MEALKVNIFGRTHCTVAFYNKNGVLHTLFWQFVTSFSGLDLLALLAFFPSVNSFFFTQNKGGGGTGSPGPSPRSAVVVVASHADVLRLVTRSSWRGTRDKTKNVCVGGY